MEPGAAPAGGVRNPALGRSRDPTGGHYDPSARSSLDRAVSGLLGAKARSGVEPARQIPRSEETWTWKRGPGIRNRRDGRREAPAFSKRERGKTEDWCATRRSIPLASRRGKRNSPRERGKVTAYPAPQRIRATMHACLEFGCLTIGSANARTRGGLAFPLPAMRGKGRTHCRPQPCPPPGIAR
jgi:hypothetical protein